MEDFIKYYGKMFPALGIKNYLINVENGKLSIIIATKDAVEIFQGNQLRSFRISEVVDCQFIAGLPKGKIKLKLANTDFTFNNVIAGRVFDFVQAIRPQRINQAGYDYSNRFENSDLINIDHAREIDELRSARQRGEISNYEYENLNPSAPKAGK